MIDKDTTRFLRYFLRAYPGRSAIMVALLVLSSFAEGIGVVTLLPLLEVGVGGNAGHSRVSLAVLHVLGIVGLPPTLEVLLAVIVVGITAKAILLWLAMREVGYTIAHVTTDLRLQMIRTLMKARWRHFSTQSRGYFAAAITGETQRASAAFRESCSVAADLVQIAVYGAISFLLSWPATLFAFATGGVFLFFLRGFVGMARTAGREQTRLIRSLSARLVDLLSAMKPVKAMALEDLVVPILEHETEELNLAQRLRVQATEGLKLFQEPMITIFIAVGLWAALRLSDSPFSSVLILAFLFYRLLRMVNSVQTRFQTIVGGESAFFLLQATMAEAERQREQFTGTLPPPPLEKGVSLQDVVFRYDERPVLDGASFDVPAGSFVALIGPSGSGKTTAADILLGLYRPEEGEVFVDGVPLADIHLLSWRQKVGYVPQDTLLFNDTLLRNVTLGDERFTADDVEEALRSADAWDFVAARPEGLQVGVGEGGGKLSGGQRQRIAIARALLRRPKLLILDEATTSLDPETEQAICRTLEKLKGKVTIMAISHQRALREIADVVYFIEEGRISQLVPDEAAV